MKIAVVHDPVPDGASADAVDTLTQRDDIVQALTRTGRVIRSFTAGLSLDALGDQLARFRPDVVVNLVESPGGHDRLLSIVPMVLETLGIPYAGAPADALFRASDKSRAKHELRRAGIPTPDWWDDDRPTAPVPFVAGDRVIVKSRWNHASAGLDADSVFTPSGDSDAVAARLAERLAAFHRTQHSPALAERFVEGREFNVSVLEDASGEPELFPVAEMRFSGFGDRPAIVDYAAKWHEDSAEYRNTVRSFDLPSKDAALVRALSESTLAAWRLWGMRGAARMDFRVDGEGRPWLLEVNPNPCLSRDAGFAAAAARAGLDYPDLIERLVALAR